MGACNTLYIAEPMFSEKIQKFDTEASFPAIKKNWNYDRSSG